MAQDGLKGTYRPASRRGPGRSARVALGAAVLLAAGVGTWYRHDLATARARLTGHSEILESAFGAIEYAQLGRGEPVLVSHGAAGGFDQGLSMAAPFAAKGYHLIAPSRFGYLRSGLPADASPQTQADAYAALLDHLRIPRVTIVGISAGAWSALAFAHRHPGRCRALVLIVPADFLTPGQRNNGGWIARLMFHSSFVTWLGIKLSSLGPGAVPELMLGTDRSVLAQAQPAEQARVRQLLQELLPVGRRWPGMQLDIRSAAPHEDVPLQEIRCPVLAISDADDHFHTGRRARQIIDAVPDGRLILYPTGGHALVGREAGAFAEVDAFLRTHPEAAERR